MARRNGPTVLLVEDNRSMREAIADYLNLEGFAVYEAGDGRDALDKLQDGIRPCAIVLDLLMPRMDGFEFRQHVLREQELAEIPLIVLSAYVGMKDLRHLGAAAVLRKPIETQRLVGTLRSVCSA